MPFLRSRLRGHNARAPISSFPLSRMSPICTRVVLPPVQTARFPSRPMTPASCSARMDCARSPAQRSGGECEEAARQGGREVRISVLAAPWRSPIATTRPGAVTRVGGGVHVGASARGEELTSDAWALSLCGERQSGAGEKGNGGALECLAWGTTITDLTEGARSVRRS